MKTKYLFAVVVVNLSATAWINSTEAGYPSRSPGYSLSAGAPSTFDSSPEAGVGYQEQSPSSYGQFLENQRKAMENEDLRREMKRRRYSMILAARDMRKSQTQLDRLRKYRYVLLSLAEGRVSSQTARVLTRSLGLNPIETSSYAIMSRPVKALGPGNFQTPSQSSTVESFSGGTVMTLIEFMRRRQLRARSGSKLQLGMARIAAAALDQVSQKISELEVSRFAQQERYVELQKRLRDKSNQQGSAG